MEENDVTELYEDSSWIASAEILKPIGIFITPEELKLAVLAYLNKNARINDEIAKTNI